MKFTAHEFAAGRVLEPPDSQAAGTVNSPSVDTLGQHREALIMHFLGDFAGGGTVTFQMQESSDNDVADPWADISGALAPASGTFTQGTDDNRLFVASLELMKRERFLRSVATVAVAAVEYCTAIVLLDRIEQPVVQSFANVYRV